jgi:hypothetical protein
VDWGKAWDTQHIPAPHHQEPVTGAWNKSLRIHSLGEAVLCCQTGSLKGKTEDKSPAISEIMSSVV